MHESFHPWGEFPIFLSWSPLLWQSFIRRTAPSEFVTKGSILSPWADWLTDLQDLFCDPFALTFFFPLALLKHVVGIIMVAGSMPQFKVLQRQQVFFLCCIPLQREWQMTVDSCVSLLIGCGMNALGNSMEICMASFWNCCHWHSTLVLCMVRLLSKQWICAHNLNASTTLIDLDESSQCKWVKT